MDGIVILGLFVISVLMSVSNAQRQDRKFLPAALKKPGARSPVNVQRDALFGGIPLYFIPNKGQVDKAAVFYARTPHYTLWMAAGELVFDSPGSVTRDVCRLVFLDANQHPEIVPLKMSEHRVNYYWGKDRSKWLTDIPTSKVVLYKNLFDRIDLKVYGQEKQVEYDWVVKPGADPKAIRFQYREVAKTHIDNKGNLIVETKAGQMVHKKPVSYQVIAGEKVPVDSAYTKAGENTYRFDVANYDRRYELVIDPLVTLRYSTYLNFTEYCNDIAVDYDLCVYVTGFTVSSYFPTVNANDNTYADFGDAFVTKFSSDGQDLEYSTYLGGTSYDCGMGITVNSSGSAYVTGYTHSEDFPIADGLYTNLNGSSDAFLTVFSPAGNDISYSTYLGGGGHDFGSDLYVDSSDCAFVTGCTLSDNFPIYNGFQQTFGGLNISNSGGDAFVTKFSSDGASLIYSTYLGGNADDCAKSIDVDSAGNAYITGYTFSSNFPVYNYYINTGSQAGDAFVTKISSTGGSLVYSTYLRGNDSRYTEGSDIVVEGSGRALVTGCTFSENFPTVYAYQNTLKGSSDAFITKFSVAGNTLVYSTYFGGTGEEWGYGITLDQDDYAYLTGYTTSLDFPTANAFQSSLEGSYDGFVTKFYQDFYYQSLVYSSYLGGADDDWGAKIFVDRCYCAYVTGGTYSTDFPTVNPLYPYLLPNIDPSLHHQCNGFVSKLTSGY